MNLESEAEHCACPECKRDVRFFPRAKPIVIEHQKPTCKLWQQVEAKKRTPAQFLIDCGVHLLVPGSEQANVSLPGTWPRD
jgi:hypothetical protein